MLLRREVMFSGCPKIRRLLAFLRLELYECDGWKYEFQAYCYL